MARNSRNPEGLDRCRPYNTDLILKMKDHRSACGLWLRFSTNSRNFQVLDLFMVFNIFLLLLFGRRIYVTNYICIYMSSPTQDHVIHLENLDNHSLYRY